jgi:hypothetical protein
MLEQLGEERVKNILSSFSSPLNEDVEYFLHHKAIEFDIQSISKTHLVFASFKKKPVLVGYFTLANKYFSVARKNTTSQLRRRLNRFGKYNTELKAYTLSAPLIAQLGKNYTNGYNELITGGELLGMAVEIIKDIQLSIGGKIVYIECEDKMKLIDFYEQNGFKQFSERELDKSDKVDGDYLIQMLKIL